MGRRLNTVFQRQENGRNFESESCNWRTSFMSSMNELNSFCRSHWKLYPGFKAENGLALDDAWDRFSHLHARSILILLAQASQSQNKKFLFLVVGIKCTYLLFTVSSFLSSLWWWCFRAMCFRVWPTKNIGGVRLVTSMKSMAASFFVRQHWVWARDMEGPSIFISFNHCGPSLVGIYILRFHLVIHSRGKTS